MDKNVETRIKAQVNFPSPPGVAQQIISLANDPEVQIATLADTVGKDPGLAAKILRIANSALYARRRRSENLRQALMVLGFKSASTLALSFSVAPLYQKQQSAGLNYSALWRRALTSAIASRTVGGLIGMKRAEDAFLASLLQDLAMLALDRSIKGFYAELPAASTHAEVCAYETKRLGLDHAAVGAMLLTHWNLPAFLVDAVSKSHVLSRGTEPLDENAALNGCVACSGLLADFLTSKRHAEDIGPLEGVLLNTIGLKREGLAEAITRMVQLLPEIEQLFDAKLIDAEDAQSLMDQARELLTIRSLESLEQVSNLQSKTVELEQRTAELQDQGRRDALTGVYNRGYLESILAAEFSSAVSGGWPLGVIFIDLDHFKQINDAHGHPAGDMVLRTTARILKEMVRDTDIVARYGGEEFVIVLPGLEIPAGQALCNRIGKALRAATHDFAKQSIRVTASLGLAVHCKQTPFFSVEAIVKAADEAVYLAKDRGRDRAVCYQQPA
jgi:diguanylate cyclase (GGDEF)-like protein